MNELKFQMLKQGSVDNHNAIFIDFGIYRFQYHLNKIRCYRPYFRLDDKLIYTETIADRKFLKIMNEYVSAEHKLKAYCE